MTSTIFTSKNLLKAYLDCRKTKRKTVNALKFEFDLENNLAALLTSLQNKTYKPGPSICFIVQKPKPREVFAADFVDRVVHHSLINEIESIWERQLFIEDSYACRKGKGNHFGVSRVATFVKNNLWYGQFDIKGFFSSINKEVLYHLVNNVISGQARPLWWQEEVLYLSKIIIFNDPTVNFRYKGDPVLKKLVPPGKSLFDQDTNTGLPIGNLTSQFFANVYLTELDQFVTKNLKLGGYARYVDDFILFSNSKDEIIKARSLVSEFLEKCLKIRLHPKKQQIQRCSHGVPFVGYFIKPKVIYCRRNVVKTLKNKIYLFNQTCQKTDPKKIMASLNSYYGHLGKSASFKLRKHLVNCHIGKDLGCLIKPKDKEFSCLKLTNLNLPTADHPADLA